MLSDVLDFETASHAPSGVSIILCCHNSEKRLEPTLRHIASQSVPTGLRWEVIIVDNASTDATGVMARQFALDFHGTTVIVLDEPRLGLSHARLLGLRNATYEFNTFVDDDNWIAPNWVRQADETMTAHPDVAICGCRIDAVYESSPPAWAEPFRGMLAVSCGPIASNYAGEVVGAGMTIRRTAWKFLVERGFRFTCDDRKGATLLSGGDIELSMAMRLAGWRLWSEETLRLRHYIPSPRLEWSYFCRLYRASGVSGVNLDAYRFAIESRSSGLRHSLRSVWVAQVIWVLATVLTTATSRCLRLSAGARSADSLRLQTYIGRLSGLWAARHSYAVALRQVAQAKWRARTGTPFAV